MSGLVGTIASFERSLLDAYRTFILHSNSRMLPPLQHPLYSFYYAEFCRLDDRPYKKKFAENAEEKQFDGIARDALSRIKLSKLVSSALDLIKDSLCAKNANLEKLIGALVIMEFYVRNIIAQPWKKEFHVILTHSGMYKLWIEPHLVSIDRMFQLFGYFRSKEGERFQLCELPSKGDLDKAALTFRLAIIICFIVYFTQKLIDSPKLSLGAIFEATQRLPINEADLVSDLKEKLISKERTRDFTKSEFPRADKDFTKLPLKPQLEMNLDLPPEFYQKDVSDVINNSNNKRDTGTQYDLTSEEELINSNVNVRFGTLNLGNIDLFEDKTKSGKRSAKAKYLDFEEAAARDYGFSHLTNKNYAMCLSPGFGSCSYERSDEESESIGLSPLALLSRNRMRDEEENLRKASFSTFKSHFPSEITGVVSRDFMPNLYQQSGKENFDFRSNDSFVEEVPSVQTDSESPLESFRRSLMMRSHQESDPSPSFTLKGPKEL